MKRIHTLLAGLAIAGISATSSGDEPGPRPSGEFRQQLIKQFDADGDGRLNATEQAAARQALEKRRGQGNRGGQSRPDMQSLLKRFDIDGDGQLNEQERAALRKQVAQMRQGGGSDRIPPQVLQRFDKDGDGKLNEQERQAAMKARDQFMKGRPAGQTGQPFDREALVKQFDKNGDGRLDEQERVAARQAFAQRGRGRDRGGNAARPAQPRKSRIDKQELLQKFDADGDGKLSPEERTAARQALQEQQAG